MHTLRSRITKVCSLILCLRVLHMLPSILLSNQRKVSYSLVSFHSFSQLLFHNFWVYTISLFYVLFSGQLYSSISSVIIHVIKKQKVAKFCTRYFQCCHFTRKQAVVIRFSLKNVAIFHHICTNS